MVKYRWLLVLFIDAATSWIVISWIKELVIGLSKTQSPDKDENSNVKIVLSQEEPPDFLTDTRSGESSLSIHTGVKCHYYVKGETHSTDQSSYLLLFLFSSISMDNCPSL